MPWLLTLGRAVSAKNAFGLVGHSGSGDGFQPEPSCVLANATRQAGGHFRMRLADGRLESLLAPEREREQRPSGYSCCGKRLGYEDGTEITNRLESVPSRIRGHAEA